MRLGILTGGGDAPGLNAAVRALVRSATAAGNPVVGVRNGWSGLLGDGDVVEMGRPDVAGILQLGGTILGTSSRLNPLTSDGGYDQVVANLRRHAIDNLVAIGGDGTLRIAAHFVAGGAAVIGLPKTIDNDLSVTEYCIGFDSAVAVVSEALDRLHTTAASHHRVMVVEVMGRDTGWLGVVGGMAGGADMILIPRFPSAPMRWWLTLRRGVRPGATSASWWCRRESRCRGFCQQRPNSASASISTAGRRANRE